MQDRSEARPKDRLSMDRCGAWRMLSGPCLYRQGEGRARGWVSRVWSVAVLGGWRLVKCRWMREGWMRAARMWVVGRSILLFTFCSKGRSIGRWPTARRAVDLTRT